MRANSRTVKSGRHSAGRRPPSMPVETPGDEASRDVAPRFAGSIEVETEEFSFCQDPQSQEILLDEAIEMTFPASDPIAETTFAARHSACLDSDELLLDDAIALTFPASDPVAFTPHPRTRR